MTVSEPSFPLSYVLATPEVSAMAMAWVGWNDATLNRLAEIGYRGVEFQTRDPRTLDATSLASSLARASLSPAGISTGPISTQDSLFIISPDEDVRLAAVQRLVEATELAADLGTHVTIGGVRGYRRWAPDSETANSWFDSALGVVLTRANTLGVTVVIEPQNRYNTDYFNLMAETIDFIDAHGSDKLAIEADVYHMALEEESVPAALVAASASGRLAHVQISDSNRLAPGWGNFNWQDIFATLRALRYDRWVSVEASQMPDSDSAALQGYQLASAFGLAAPNNASLAAS